MVEFQETTFIFISVVTKLLGVTALYHDKYFVKKPAQNQEKEKLGFHYCLYQGSKTDCIENLRVRGHSFVEF